MYDVHGHLVATGTHGQWVVIDGLEVASCGIAETAGGEIYKTRLHTNEGEGDVIERHILLVGFAPFGFFHAEYSFEVDDVGEGAVDACGSIDAVEVEHQFVVGTCLADAVNHLDSRLVIAVKEIDFEAFDSHGSVFLACFLQVFVEHIEYSPKEDAYSLRLSVFNQFWTRDGITPRVATC